MDKEKAMQLIREAVPCLTDGLQAPEDLRLAPQIEMFRKMCLIREFDTQVRTLWMEGQIYGLVHSYVGAEAIAVGACTALGDGDLITSTHRGHGHALAKGADIKAMMAELHGKYEGLNHGKGGSMHIADIGTGMLGATGIAGSGVPVALGSALSSKVLKNGKVTVCFHGDGGTNQGVWHESVNMAAAWDLPVIFLIENNQYAIATEAGRVTKEKNLYKRAFGYGIEGVQVDGFNVFEVYKAVKAAVAKARAGGGPALIEARFMRLPGHYVSDDQWYRDKELNEIFWLMDPIKRMRDYFIGNGLLMEEEVNKILEEAIAEIAEAVDYAQNQCTEPPASILYDDIYANSEIII